MGWRVKGLEGECCRVGSLSACLHVDDAVPGDLSVSADGVLLFGRLTQFGSVSHPEDLADLATCYSDLAEFLFYGKYWVLSIIKLNSHKHYSEVAAYLQSS